MEQTASTYDSSRSRKLIRDEIRDLVRFRHLAVNMIRRNLTARYKRSVLGVLWTLLDPLLTMTVMAIVYSALFATSIPGFPVFILSGLLVWVFISQSTTSAMVDIVNSGNLIGKVYIPKSIFVFSAVGTGIANLTISLIPISIFIALFRIQLTFAIFFLPVSILIASIFTLGLGLIMAAYAALFADMQNIFNILMRVLMYLSGIFYTAAILPSPLRTVVLINPTYHLVKLFRDPIYGGEIPGSLTIAISTVTAIAILVLGLTIFTRLADEIVYRV